MAERADLLFELGTEELPPVALKRLADALSTEFVAGLERSGLEHGEVQAFATPRRLGLLVKSCALQQPDRQQAKDQRNQRRWEEEPEAVPQHWHSRAIRSHRIRPGKNETVKHRIRDQRQQRYPEPPFAAVPAPAPRQDQRPTRRYEQ